MKAEKGYVHFKRHIETAKSARKYKSKIVVLSSSRRGKVLAALQRWSKRHRRSVCVGMMKAGLSIQRKYIKAGEWCCTCRKLPSIAVVQMRAGTHCSATGKISG
jgi:hypothetical protein